ncbi:MAG TPA: TonB-dependent receptor plug domain-containing protein [Gemmatimonadaceae bacterium]|jgi:outer membrane cobalamin receptor
MTARLLIARLIAAALAVGFAQRAIAQVPGELRGRLTNARTAQTIENAQVEIVGATTVRSNSGGEYVARGLEPGNHTVRIRAFGFAELREDVTISNGRTTVLDVGLDPSATALEAVNVRAAADSNVRGAMQFDRAAIVSSSKRDVGELLQSVPGLVITQTGGPGAPSRVSIRGSASNEVLILVDGVPINSQLDGEVDLSRISLETAERVVVLTGAQSARYGPRALGGVIAITTRRPTRELSALERAGAWGEHNSSLTIGDQREIGDLKGGLSFTGGYRTSRGDFSYDVPAVRGGGTATRQNAGLTSRQALGTASLEGDGWDARIRGGFDDLSRGMAGSIVQPSLSGHQTQQRSSGGFDARGQRGLFSWTTLGDVTHDRAAFIDTTPPFGGKFDDTVRATGASSSVSSTIGRDDRSASLGADLQALDVTSTMLAVGAPHWQRTVGTWGRARVSHQATQSLLLDGELAGRIDNTSLVEGSNFSPQIALGATTPFATFSASLGAGYAPPSLSDQFFHEGVQVRPNPSLQPERTRHDLEGRVSIHEQTLRGVHLSGDAAAYRADVDGMILWMPDFRFIWSPSNFDVARSGWELGSRASWPMTRLDVQGSFARSDVMYRGPVLNGQVAYRPRNSGNVTAGFSPGPLRFEATTRYVGARRTVPGSAINVLDPYWRTDLKISYTRRVQTWRIDANVGLENALDQPATMLVDYPFPSRAWSVSLRLQRDGRVGR